MSLSATITQLPRVDLVGERGAPNALEDLTRPHTHDVQAATFAASVVACREPWLVCVNVVSERPSD